MSKRVLVGLEQSAASAQVGQQVSNPAPLG
jgi:hypothetical protein